MRTALLLASLLGLAGCQSVEQLRAQAPAQPDFNICKAMVMGNPTLQQVAAEERARRGLDCTPHLPMIQAQAQADAARAALGLQMMQASRPQPYQVPFTPMQVPQTTYCNSQVIGNQVHTNCR